MKCFVGQILTEDGILSVMIANIVGSIFIISGLLFLLNPELFRRRLQRKGTRKIRRYLFAATVVAGAMLISVGWGSEVRYSIVFVIAGLVVLVRGLMFLRAKSADFIAGALLKMPALYLRLLAVCQIIVGILIVMA